MRKMTKHLILLGLLVLTMALAACGGNDGNDGNGQDAANQSPAQTPTQSPAQSGEPNAQPAIGTAQGLPVGMDPASLALPRLERPERFTFRDQNSFPEHWNPHGRLNTNVQVTTQRDFTSLRFSKIYAPNIPGETFGQMFVAATDTRDITAQFDQKERFGIPADATSGLVYVVDIRQDLRWDDGTPINAHDWERSMQHLLNPDMMNHGAAGWANVFVGAADYLAREGPWENVGVFASGDYQLTFVLLNWTNMFDFRQGIHGEWLVHEEMYTAGFSWEEDLLITNYNTTVETSRFAGPFMIVSAELDRQVVLTRNPYWFGWNDPAFDDFYMMTDIIIDVIPEPATRMMLFNQGMLDRILVGADDFETYRFSEHLAQWETTNLFRFVFNTDLDMLRGLEQDMGDGYNRQVLSLRDFRRAISFAIDRTRYTQQGTAGHVPSVVLLENYFYDFSNNPNSRFRENEHAMRAVVNFYDMAYGPGTPFATLADAYHSITGFNLHLARELFQSAYEEAIELGIYTSGQPINIQLVAGGANALTPAHMRQNDLIREMLQEATVGTGFEGLLDITFLGNFPQAHDALIEGRLEARNAAWGGSIFTPIGLMGVYTNAVNMGGINNINESAGWDPTTATLTMTFDWDGTGETTRTKTFQDWHMAISGVGEFVGDEFLDVRNFVLANLEVGVLDTFQTIPHSVQVMSILVGMKIYFLPGYYHPMFDDLPGPRSQIGFNFTDDAWTEFVASQGGTLNYE